MNNTIKAVAAGAVAAVGTHYGDQYVHGDASPHKPIVYYGAAAVAAGAAFWLRKKHPVIAGALGGAAIGSVYQGYTRAQAPAQGAALSTLAVPLNLGAENAAKPLIKIGIPITRKSKTGDMRAFSSKIAPYGVSPDGYPLRSAWPYGLDGDRFARPRPAQALPSAPSSDFNLGETIEQGKKLFDQYGGNVDNLINTGTWGG